MKFRSPLLPLQKAVLDRLRLDVEVPGTAKVFNYVPANTAFDYVVLGEDTGGDWSTKSGAGSEGTVTVFCETQARGETRAKQLMDAVIQALTRDPPLNLSADNFNLFLFRPDLYEVQVGPDDYTRTAIVRFRYKIQDLAT